MHAQVKDGKLIITLPLLETPTMSSTGKSFHLVSNVYTPSNLVIDGKVVRISVNAIVPTK